MNEKKTLKKITQTKPEQNKLTEKKKKEKEKTKEYKKEPTNDQRKRGRSQKTKGATNTERKGWKTSLLRIFGAKLSDILSM